MEGKIFEKKIIDNASTFEDSALNEDFNIKELEKAISETKDTAPGKDDIQAKMIWNLPGKLGDIILQLFNKI